MKALSLDQFKSVMKPAAASFRHAWLRKSKTISVRESAVSAAICFPSGDQRLVQRPSEPGRSVVSRVLRSNMWILAWLRGAFPLFIRSPKANFAPSGDQVGAPCLLAFGRIARGFPPSKETKYTFH